MLLRTSKGMFQVIKNTKNAFDLQTFESKYIEECFDAYPYIVGDLSSNIVRLKGFSNDSKAQNYYKNINDYIFDSCAFRCPVYVLRRIKSEEEYEKLLKNPVQVDLGDEKKFTLVKENYDKETLVLESTPKNKPNIIIDINKINSIPKHVLPSDLELAKKEETNTKIQNKQNNNQKDNSSIAKNNFQNNNQKDNSNIAKNSSQNNNQKDNSNIAKNSSQNNNQKDNSNIIKNSFQNNNRNNNQNKSQTQKQNNFFNKNKQKKNKQNTNSQK